MLKVYLFAVFTMLYSQNQNVKNLPTIDANFTAIIVTDINKSIDWYKNSLGFEVLNRFDSEERGFSQANLKTGNSLLELIEIKSAIKIQNVYPNYSKKTKFVGLFKIGYQLDKFDDWVNHFRNLKLNFHGDVVKDKNSNKRMLILKDPDGNRVQFFEK